MKIVTGQYQQAYQLDEKTRKKESDGDSFKVSGTGGTWVKLLKDHSKEKQLEIEHQIAMGGFEEGAPREIVYSRGRFAGYIYEKNEVIEETFSDSVEYPVKSGNTEEFWESNVFKISAAIVIAVLLGLIQVKILYTLYIGILLKMLSSSTVSICAALSFSGITAMIAGIAGMILIGYFMQDASIFVFLFLEAAAFLAGVVALDIFLTLAVVVVVEAINLLMAILPAVITIMIFVIIVKKVLHIR